MMAQIERAVGIDCGKKSLDVALSHSKDIIRVTNDAAGLQELLGWVGTHDVRRVGLEATGGYERRARDELTKAGYAVQVFDPSRVRYFAKAKGRRAKSDPIDAAVIAEFTAFTPETDTVAIDSAREELAGLVRTRAGLADRRADLVKMRATAVEAAWPDLDALIEHHNVTIRSIEATIKSRVAANDNFGKTADSLQTAPGIGFVTAVSIVAMLPELGHLAGGKISALVGVAPFDRDSGQFHGQRHIAGGRADLRKALYMATMVAATRTKGVINEFYRRLIAAGKKPKVALVACMRKMVVRLNAMLASGSTWQEQPEK